ncbi:PREDICTED: thioredoxin domain-containing protein 15 [Nanorana parkeri]|uniref:thioredoxin domain-containing protein 15 n=1 Tax=Nanorana parkeri TaxID=125878 RepID=UPI0008545425|nr:PREDICTED: thioredoxin domain-containing protein 15 [Nanorana parkeri]
MDVSHLYLRAVITFGVFSLSLTPAALENYNEDSYSEDENETGVLQNADAIAGSINSESIGVSETVQYKTAEIADAMQSSDIQTDPAVLFSMVPKDWKNKVVMETSDAESQKAEGECSTNECPDSTSDAQMKTKMQNTESDASNTKQIKTDDSNSTDGNKPLKVNCVERNITGMDNFTLQVLNASQDLMELLNPNSSECTMVLFFTPWCLFSAALAPHFNALPRAFPTLHFLALDASQHSSLSTRFGTVAVPNMLLFQGAKPMARFNHTERTLEPFKAFIFNQSGIEAKPDVTVTEADYEGPLPCTPQTGIDWLLVFSVLYVTAFVIYATMQTDRIRWLVPGQEHEHQE